MKIQRKGLIHNKFEFEVRDANTGELKQKAYAYNVVLNNYFVQVMQGRGPLYKIEYGGGSGTPAITDTALFTYIGYKIYSSVSYAYAYPTSYMKLAAVLAPEDAVGATITEIGLKNPYNVLLTHAMLVDSEGSPISIYKSDTDIITIYATVYCVVPDEYMEGSANILKGSNAQYDPLVSLLLSGGSILASGSNLGINVSSLKYEEGAKISYLCYSGQYASEGRISAGAPTVNNTNFTLTWTNKRFDVNTGNSFVRAFIVGYYDNYGSPACQPFFAIFLPDTNVFAGYTETDLSLGSGDGLTTDFNILCPEIDADSDVVKVNGITKTRGTDYTINPNAAYLAGRGDSLQRGCNRWSSNYTDVNSSPVDWTKFENIVSSLQYAGSWASVDLGEAKLVGGIRVLPWASSSGTFGVYYSDNGTDWTLAENLSWSATMWYWTAVLPLTTPTSHRYWKVTGSLSAFEVVSGEKALKFTTAPAVGDAITISYTTPYIKKNTNYVMDVSFQVQLGRYEG